MQELNYSKEEAEKEIQKLTQQKTLLLEESEQLKRVLDDTLIISNKKVLSINEEQGGKFFSDVLDGKSFSDRLESSFKWMRNEIRAMEKTMELNGDIDDELETSIQELAKQERILQNLMAENAKPFEKDENQFPLEDSREYLDYGAGIFMDENNMLETFEIEDQPFDTDFKKIEKDKKFELRQISQRLKSKSRKDITNSADLLAVEAEKIIKQMQEERDFDAKIIENNYDKLLAQFILDTERSVHALSGQYESFVAKQNRVKELAQEEGMSKEPSWKEEIWGRMEQMLEGTKQRQKYEKSIDAALIKKMRALQVEDLDTLETLDVDYLESVINHLSSQYLKSVDQSVSDMRSKNDEIQNLT